MEFTIIEKQEFKTVGIELSGPYSDLYKIGPLWGTFVEKIAEISSPVHPEAKQ
ncbi:hypothetical protein ACFSO7_15815 [Bacillus sp. CGMCC 1.16607]|uniref:hypothetical protein n=1 Tax=Bacillus sp. CGMCC 1.16607 TaxID=3351842 RepID=UPI00362C4C2A